MKPIRTPAFSAALGLFVPASLALCAHLVAWWVFLSGCRWPLAFHEGLEWAGGAILLASSVLLVAGLARLLRAAFRVPRLAAVAWALAAAATGLWPLVAILPSARRAGNAAAARLAAWGGALFLVAAALAVAGRAGAPVFWPLLASGAAGTALVLASLRALDGGSRPHRALAWAFAAVLLVSLATQPALHVARVRRQADAAFAELREAIGAPADPESFYPGPPPVAEADDPVAALDPGTLEAQTDSFRELRTSLGRADGGRRRHPYQPEETAAVAAWFASHADFAAAAGAMTSAGYRSCLPGPASFAEAANECLHREPRAAEIFGAAFAAALRARLEIAAGDSAAAADAVRRMENAARLFDEDPMLIAYLFAGALRFSAFALVSERIDLWSDDDLLALQRAADAAADAAGDRLRIAIAWDTLRQEAVFDDFARNNFPQFSAVMRGSGAPDLWLAAERRARYRDSALSWKAADAVLRAGPDAAVGKAIDRLDTDETARGAFLPPLSRMLFTSLSSMLETVVGLRDHASFVRAAVAVERYRRAHGGALPPSLDALVPEYLPAVPRAARTGDPLAYEPGPLDIPEETLCALRGPDEAGTRVLPAQTLPGFRLVLPARRGRDEDVAYDFVLYPPPSAADGSHPETAEPDPHAESAETAEP